MAKYYVQSGNVKTIVSADDSEKAALWTIHCAMRQVVPVYDDEELTPQAKSDVAVIQGLMVLGHTLRTSELGFDRADALEFDTFDLVVHWHQLMIALAKLEAMVSRSRSTFCKPAVEGKE